MWQEMSYNRYNNSNNFFKKLEVEPEETKINIETWAEWIYEGIEGVEICLNMDLE